MEWYSTAWASPYTVWDVIGGVATVIASIYNLTSGGANTAQQIAQMQQVYGSLLKDIQNIRNSIDDINNALRQLPDAFGKIVEKQAAIDRLLQAEVTAKQIASRTTSQASIVANRDLLNNLIASAERDLLFYVQRFDPDCKAPLSVVPACAPVLGIIGQAHTVVQRALFTASGQDPEQAPTVYDLDLHNEMRTRIKMTLDTVDGIRAKHNHHWVKEFPDKSSLFRFTATKGFERTGRPIDTCDPGNAWMTLGVATANDSAVMLLVPSHLLGIKYDPSKPCSTSNSPLAYIFSEESKGDWHPSHRKVLEQAGAVDALAIPQYQKGWAERERDAGYLRAHWDQVEALGNAYRGYMEAPPRPT